MAVHALATAAAPLLDPAGYSGRNLALSPLAHGALNAWCMLSLARLGLQRGLYADVGLTLAVIQAHGRIAPAPVARRIARDLISLRAALAVADALSPSLAGACP